MVEWLERHRADLAAALVVLVTVAAAVLLQVPRRPALQLTSPSSATGPAPIKVHVVGAVLAPAVYQLEADARVEDALKAAGGPSDAADLGQLNLATALRDGQQVLIPSKDAPAGAPGALLSSPIPSPVLSPSTAVSPAVAPRGSPTSRLLKLNSASQKDLEALPGIGEVTATKILEYRRQQGRIGSLEELRTAKVINASMYDKIKDLVEVD